MSIPKSRDQLKDWCLRQLGWPVIEINVDDDQVDDRVDEAFQFFQDYHFDGVEHTYTKHQITTDDITNEWIPVTDNIIGVTRVLPFAGSNTQWNMFDVRYQMRLHDLYDFTSTSYVNYTLTMQHLRTINMLFTGEQTVRFNRHTNKLYIDWDWKNFVQPGQYIIIEAQIITDPESYPKVYNDRLLKKLATAYIKRQWGANMSKYKDVPMMGGMKMDGATIYSQAMEEINAIETLIQTSMQDPPSFIMG